MTEALAEKKCTPCRGDLPPLTLAEAEHFRSQTPNWELHDDGHRIERTFRFSNFQEALGFVREVGNLAEAEGHHPDVSFGWGYATISLRTKKIKGLHENDFIMASKIDRIFDAPDLQYQRSGCVGFSSSPKEPLSATWRGRCIRVDAARHSVIKALPQSG